MIIFQILEAEELTNAADYDDDDVGDSDYHDDSDDGDDDDVGDILLMSGLPLEKKLE